MTTTDPQEPPDPAVQPAPPPPPAPPKPTLLQLARAAPVSALIVAANMLVFLLMTRAGSTTSHETLLRFGAVWRRLVWEGQYWRLVTSMFLHIGLLHLLCNCFFGFRISAPAERALGRWRFLALYFASGIAGSAASVIGHDAVSAGASGALFGLLGWRFVVLRRHFGAWKAMVQHPDVRQELVWVAGWFVIGAFAGFDNYAHAGGLVFGGAISWALSSPPERRGRRLGATALALVALVGLALRPLPVVHASALALQKARASQDDPAAVIALTEPLLRSSARMDALSLRAWAFLQLGRADQALDAANELIARNPKFGLAHAVRGRAMFMMGNRRDPETDYQEALRLDPGLAPIVDYFRKLSDAGR